MQLFRDRQERAARSGSIARATRLTRVAATVLLATSFVACGGGPKPDADPSLDAATLNGARLLAVDGGQTIEVTADRPVTWTATSESDRVFSIHLEDTVPGAALTNLATEAGMVESVVFTPEEIDGRPMTTMRVTSRQRAVHAVQSEGNSLQVRVRSETEPPTRPAGTPAAPAPAAPGGMTPPSRRAAAGAAATRSEYTISPGDLLAIDVFGHDEFDRKARVQDDGKIALPLVGRFDIAGRTLEEAEEEIERTLQQAELLSSPEVFVDVEEYASYGVTVQGAVARPGIYPVVGRKSLLEIIWAAGGLVESAGGGQKIVVLRPDGRGQQSRIEVDAERLIDEGDMSLNIPLLPGDNIVVPKAKKKRVYVSGAVQRPGPVDFLDSQGLTVLQAITLAGGPTERANLGNVVVIRQLPDGGQETLKVNVKKIQKGKANDVFLENNDTVRVAVWFF